VTQDVNARIHKMRTAGRPANVVSERPPAPPWQLNDRPPRIIFAALVDEAGVTIPLTVGVGQDHVDLVALERSSLVTSVVEHAAELPESPRTDFSVADGPYGVVLPSSCGLPESTCSGRRLSRRLATFQTPPDSLQNAGGLRSQAALDDPSDDSGKRSVQHIHF